MTAAFGPGGSGASTDAPGAPGSVGTIHMNGTSTLVRGVETVLGPEESTPSTK
jgi:hypothetical protein